MPKREKPLENGRFYHVYNRVAPNKKLFYSAENYTYFLKLWKKTDFTLCCRLIAYCLMPNHYHFLVQMTDAALFTKKISYVFDRYLKALNNQRKESGQYFKDRFKAKIIENENYLLAVCCYIHLNPVKAHLVDSLAEWPFLNYFEFTGMRSGVLWDEGFFEEYVVSSSDYENYLASRYNDVEIGAYIFDE